MIFVKNVYLGMVISGRNMKVGIKLILSHTVESLDFVQWCRTARYGAALEMSFRRVQATGQIFIVAKSSLSEAFVQSP